MAEFKIDQNSFIPFSHNAAGQYVHIYDSTPSTRPLTNMLSSEGISSNASGTMVIKPCTQAEIDFYTVASTDPAHAAFYAHMPHFFGSLKASPNQEDLNQLLQTAGGDGVAAAPVEVEDALANVGALTPSHTRPNNEEKDAWQPSGGKKLSTGLMIAISNAAAGITKPCVIDLKLGARLWDDDSPLAKRQKLDEVSNESTSGSLGFRVAGMKVWAGDEVEQNGKEEHCEIKDGFKAYDKFYGRDLTKETVMGAFETFLGGVQGGKLKRKYANLVRKRFVRELESMEYTLQHEESRMYSASILMVYEGDDAALERTLELEKQTADEDEDEDDAEEDDDDDEAEPKVHDVCLIDFAHAKFEKGVGPDENALQGVRSALYILKSLG
jgi:inositol-polyphosphate multikinase